ncbi:hypothetical protein L207DRAFT_580059 [Hyaloscypha variabilis F]|uniref:Ubiquitin 3 binding protein But2 C-terminal domain-containing protein n=1 Tax=Hyaloscypha variabilis (strain UAMH 11265 / GT02V1 / F) TaxID=1149755 RepID=A0A2J6RXE7_HYAVF|nr:hypothetical protein L207DRAFT_580059 [Hyaloscypha variabilis F]
MLRTLFQLLVLLSFSEHALGGSCNGDNCLNAMRNHAVSASSFCTPFLASTQTATTGIPTFLTACSASPSKLSSGCSCILSSTTSSSSISTTSGSTCTATATITPVASTVTVTLSPSCSTVAATTCPAASTTSLISYSTVTTTVTVTATPTCSFEIVGGDFEDAATGDLSDFTVSSNPSDVGFYDTILTPSQQNAFNVPPGIDQFLFINFESIIVVSPITYTLQQVVGTCASPTTITLSASVFTPYDGGSINFCISSDNCSPFQTLDTSGALVQYSATFVTSPGTPLTATLNIQAVAFNELPFFVGVVNFVLSND